MGYSSNTYVCEYCFVCGQVIVVHNHRNGFKAVFDKICSKKPVY